MTICRTIKDQFGSAISKSVVASTRSEMIADVRMDDKNVLTLKICYAACQIIQILVSR